MLDAPMEGANADAAIVYEDNEETGDVTGDIDEEHSFAAYVASNGSAAEIAALSAERKRKREDQQVEVRGRMQEQELETLHSGDTLDCPSSQSAFWVYVDPASLLQGPYSSDVMHGWCSARYFSQTLLVAAVGTEFDSSTFDRSALRPIGSLWSTLSEAFVAPPMPL